MELQKNVFEILEGEFKGIMSSQDDAKRLSLKLHLAKVIKEIKIHFYYLRTGQLATWFPEVTLHSGQKILIQESPENEIYRQKYGQENDLDGDLNEKEEKVEAVH